MYRIILYLNVVLILGFFACSKYSGEDCSPSDDCYPYTIDSGYVNISLSYSGSGAGIPVVLYEGYVEDGNVIWADTVYDSQLTFWLPINKRYAAEAYYSIGGNLTVALDGEKLKEDSYYDCGEQCYEIAEIDLDVEKL